MSKTIGIIDEPVQPGAQDQLDINVHAVFNRLYFSNEHSNNCRYSGRVGSGKTSLINSIYHHFNEDEQKVKQIWINSWEYSLLSTPEETLKIINRIIDELIEADKTSKRSKKLQLVLRKSSKAL